MRSDNYINAPAFKDTYNSLVSARTALGVPGLESPLQEEAEWKTLQSQKNNKISNTASMILSGLYYNYSQIRSDALANNQIKVINGTYDDSYINGVWQNPYETKLAFAITAPVQEINLPNVSISLPATLWHTNHASSISSIQVDFGNGTGYKNLSNNAVATTFYNTAGVYTWTYRLQLSNGQYKYCRQKMKVNVPTASKANINCSLQTLSITASRSYLGVAGKATLQIAYGSSDCKLRKPLIVAEGLDTGLLAASGSIGDSDYYDFNSSVFNSGSTDLRNLITNNTAIDYDVVYVNWDNGTDYLQRNAYVLEEVIKWVNQQKAANGSTTPNVVLGQSMGGVIARYALRDMENEPNLSHDTNLYISHDSPHQGAHVPLGLLYMARHVADQFIGSPVGNISIPVNGANVGLGTANDLLDAPAVKQMLINYVNNNFTVDNNVHETWQNELKLMGYPQQTRNIALSNASHCASPQEVTAGQRLLTIDAFGKTTTLTDIILSITGLGDTSATLAAILLDEPGLLFGILPGRSKFDLDFWANAYPASGTAQIYYGKIRYTKTLLWLVNINITLTQRSYNSPSGTLPLDTYPGGKNPSFEDIDISNFENNAFIKYGYTVDFEPDFNFIPATSALDVGKNNVSLSSADYLKVYTAANPPTGTKAIPFANFTTSYNTSSINEPHISFNSRNGNWLAEEMDGDITADIFDCSYVCSNAEISGAGTICSGSSTYSFPTSTLTWSISNSTLASIVSNGNMVTVTKKGNGTVILTANIPSSDCGPAMTVSKTINLGANVKTNLLSNVSSTEAKLLITGIGINTAPTYTVQYSYGSATLSMINNYDGSYTLWGRGSTNTWYKDVSITIISSCGSETRTTRITPPAASGGCTYTLQSTDVNTYALLPPPDCLSSFETMNFMESSMIGTSESTTLNTYAIIVYDLNGVVVLETDEQSISLESLDKGFYFIKAIWNGNETTKKVAKK